MSKEYDNTNRGVLFANKERRGDKDPHARGTINIEGKEYWLSAWTQTSKAGERYQSLSVQPKQPKDEKPVPQEQGGFDDSIPF